jgi:regulatory protein
MHRRSTSPGDNAPASESDPREERRAAEQAALRILGGAAQSEVALRRRLQRRGFSEEASRAAAESAVRAGYVDDGRLAQSIVDRRRGGRGTARIAAELRARGVDDDVVRTAVAAVSPDEQRESAVREARRRLRDGLPDDPAERRRALGRVGGALSRLGFTGDVVRHALARVGAEPWDDA